MFIIVKIPIYLRDTLWFEKLALSGDPSTTEHEVSIRRINEVRARFYKSRVELLRYKRQTDSVHKLNIFDYLIRTHLKSSRID